MQTYNEIYHLYGEISEAACIEPGYEFFQELSNPKGIRCISANGKSNIIKTLLEKRHTNGKLLLVVDGAAFGLFSLRPSRHNRIGDRASLLNLLSYYLSKIGIFVKYSINQRYQRN